MNPEKNLENDLNSQGSQLPIESERSALEKEKSVEDYIFGTLLYTPQFYAKNQDYVDIKVYAPDQQQPSMKIFRMIGRYSPQQGDPENSREVSFQDEVDILKDGKADNMERWQINFSVLVDKETFEFKSIREKPKDLSRVEESINVFRDLAKQKGSILFAGDWKFESDGNGWVPVNRDGAKMIEPQLKSLAPSIPSIE